MPPTAEVSNQVPQAGAGTMRGSRSRKGERFPIAALVMSLNETFWSAPGNTSPVGARLIVRPDHCQ